MNILPLVDVMLVLLTIVLTTATFVAKGLIPVELPAVEKSAKASQTREQSTLIEITQTGEIYLNAVRRELSALGAELKDKAKDAPIIIRADKRMQLDLFLQVIAKLKKSGFSNISVQTEEKA